MVTSLSHAAADVSFESSSISAEESESCSPVPVVLNLKDDCPLQREISVSLQIDSTVEGIYVHIRLSSNHMQFEITKMVVVYFVPNALFAYYNGKPRTLEAAT